MEGLVNSLFWNNKKVLITGHTGFKGGWLALWLKSKGADVVGYSLDPPSSPNLFSLAKVSDQILSIKGDICEYSNLFNVIQTYKPEIIFHMAAQSLVRRSYQNPLHTFYVNVMGTVNLFEAVRNTESVKAVVNVTSDKCYENKEWIWRYRENDALGGFDPYSCSKGCAEFVTSSYRNSFFGVDKNRNVGIASVRAGNVIGGGDWAEDRLIPDIVRSIISKKPILIRNPFAVRPWQHVLEALNGYIMIAEKIYFDENREFCESWNFGPSEENEICVKKLVQTIISLWEEDVQVFFNDQGNLHEANCLKLDSSKARIKMGWKPKLSFDDTLKWTIDWYKKYQNDRDDVYSVTMRQIERYENIG